MADAIYQPSPRQTAVAGQPIMDPAAWREEDFRECEPWVHRLSDDEINDIVSAVGRVEQRGLELTKIAAADFTLGPASEKLARLHHELVDGVGIVQVRGLPVENMTARQAAIAFMGMGTHFGGLKSQNAEGHLLGHVKNLGKDYNDPMVRGYQTATAMGFHSDPCDFVALLCLKTAQSGGESRVVSSVALYNEMLSRRPDLAAELVQDFYWTHHGEVSPGEKPWYKMPVFSFEDGYFSARGISARIMKAPELPGVPPFTPAQKEAIDLFRALTQEMAVDIPFQRGDFQILSNHVMLHTRRAFEDWPILADRRHLYRLWISDPTARPIPDIVREGFKGVEVAGFIPKAPLDAEAA